MPLYIHIYFYLFAYVLCEESAAHCDAHHTHLILAKNLVHVLELFFYIFFFALGLLFLFGVSLLLQRLMHTHTHTYLIFNV